MSSVPPKSAPVPPAESATSPLPLEGVEEGSEVLEAEPDAPLTAGTLVGRYVIVSLIGRGGMGVVYSAYDTQLDRKIAVKLLLPEEASDKTSDESRQRLLREAQVMARLSHPNVVAVHDVGMFGDQVFLAMEFIDGVTLTQWIKRNPSLKQRLRTMVEAGRGLSAAHAAGLVHRDFKPDNVLVGNDGRVRVMDFGLARVEVQPERAPSVAKLLLSTGSGEHQGGTGLGTADPLTTRGTVMGTRGYVAPEQLAGDSATALGDQFSFSVTAYYALYGERPFSARTAAEYMRSIRRGPNAAPANAHVPARLRNVLRRGLERQPERRFAKLDDLLDALVDDPAARVRRLVWFALLSVSCVAPLLVHAVRDRWRGDACVPDATALDALWGPKDDRAMKEAFAATSVVDSAAAATRIAERMEKFVSEWSSMSTEVCRDAESGKGKAAEISTLRHDCLERERMDVRAMSVLLTHADERVVKSAADIAYGLPEVAWCADIPTLRASAGLPDDPARRAIVLSVREQLARVKALATSGKALDAAPLSDVVLESARKAGHPPTLAEALYYAGDVRNRGGDFGRAFASFREATWLALAIGSDAVAVRSASAQAYLVSTKFRRNGEAEVWLDASRAAFDRIGPGASDELAAEVLRAEANVFGGAEHPEKAIVADGRVLAAYRRIYGTHPQTAAALYDLGADYDNAGDLAHARPLYEESLGMFQTLTGAASMETGKAEYALGGCLVRAGEVEKGEAMLKSAVAVLDTSGTPFWTALALSELVYARLLQGDAKGALAYGRRGLALLPLAEDTPELVPYIVVATGLAMAESGDAPGALSLCDRGLAQQERSGEIAPENVYLHDALRCRAEALMRAGRLSDAIASLERSLGLHRRLYPGDYARAELSMAVALRTAHRERALELATKARDEFARFPHLKYELGRATAFLEIR